MTHMRRRTDFYLGLGTLLFVAATAALVIAEPFRSDDPPVKAFELKAAEGNGRIRVDWDPNNPALRTADSATLEVHDGPDRERYPVDKQVLLSGGLDYLRKTSDVLLTLTLNEGGEPGLRATVRTISAVEQPAPVEAPQEESSTRARGRRRR